VAINLLPLFMPCAEADVKVLTMPAAMPNMMNGVTSRHLLMLSAGILCCIGLVMVSSASMVVGETRYDSTFYFLFRHLVWMVGGLVAGMIAMNIPVERLQKNVLLLLLISFALLVIVLIPGIGKRINGSMRWIGVGPLTMQPSEAAKFAVVLYMASYLVRRQDVVRSQWRGFITPMAVVFLGVFLLLLEPDFGASVVMVSAAMAMLFLAGTPILQFAVMISLAAVAAVFAVILEPYRLKRMVSFMDPWADQFNSGYQLSQSLIAFGRGEWFGVGLGRSIQKLSYLPEAHTDFVFAIYAEEFGLVGVLIMIALFWLLVRSILKIGQAAELGGRIYGAYVAYGVAVLIGMQALFNIGVNMGLFPTKGLTLPLVSYGGSSLLAVFAMLGVVLRIDTENKQPALAPAKGGRP
jgi:cell division protein FtsW